MRAIAVVGLLLVILLVSLSSYLRLDHSGIGCSPWPDCYGNIGAQQDEQSVLGAYERLVAEARQPLSWARPLHRLVASTLGVLVILLTVISMLQKRWRRVSAGLLVLTVFLAWLGIYSQGLHSKAVVMGNLGGGFAMLGLFAWLVVGMREDRSSSAVATTRLSGRWTLAVLVVTALQILLGGLTSANFAAAACPTLPDCNGAWLPVAELGAAFQLSAALDVNTAGYVVGGLERAAIHMLHRAFAVITVVVVSIVAVVAIRSGTEIRSAGAILLGMVLMEAMVGIAAVSSDLPIAIAVAHNWIAGMLLMVLVYLLAKSPWKTSHRIPANRYQTSYK